MGKKQEDYTIHNVLHHVPKFIAEAMDDEQRSTFDNNLAYLRNIANSMTYAKVSGQSFIGLFGDKPFYDYTPQEINKALAEALKAPEPVATDFQAARLLASKDSKLLKYDTQKLESKINSCKSDLRGYQDQIERYYRNINDYLKTATKTQQELDEYEQSLAAIDVDGKNVEVERAIQEVIASGKWLYVGSFGENDGLTDEQIPKMFMRSPYNTDQNYTDKGTLKLFGHIFIATEKTTCSHISRSSKAIKRANFGNLFVCMDASGQIKRAFFGLDSYGSALTALHPHISSTGDVCWGNAGSAYSNLVRDNKPNYLSILTLFTSLMETYSPDNPYQRIDSYMDKNVVKRHAILVDPVLLSYIPTEFLQQQLTPEQITEYQLEEANKELKNRYLAEYKRNNLKHFSDIPQGLQSKLAHLAEQLESRWAELLETHSYSDVIASDLIEPNALEDSEWDIIVGTRVRTISSKIRTYLFILNYLRHKENGNGFACRYKGSEQQIYKPSDKSMHWDERYVDHFNWRMDFEACPTSNYSVYKLFNHPDDVDCFVPTFEQYRSSL